MAVREPSDEPSERYVLDRFESFDLSIERVGEAYQARVTDSPVGPRLPVSVDPAGLDAGEPSPAGSAEAMRDVKRRPAGLGDLQRVGERLFLAVFVGEVIEAFRTSVERVRHQSIGLRVCLQLDEVPELSTLPWEALWDPKDRAFLADQPDLPVVRVLGIPAEEPLVSPATTPLRVLAVLPEPRGESKLGGTVEWQQIIEHLAPLVEAGEVAAEQLKPPTLDALGSRIDAGPCHVLHIVAHGGPGDPGAGGLLKLEGPSNKPDSVSGGDLARALKRREAPRLVVLSACHGARAAVDDAFDGMAQHLLNRGIPAVVAMRTAITDAAAVSFASALYRELAEGRTVEAAMVEARRALSLGEHRTEWATPALYLRGENVRILEPGTLSGLSRPSRNANRRTLKALISTAAVVAAGLLGVWMWPSKEPQVSISPFMGEVVEEPQGAERGEEFKGAKGVEEAKGTKGVEPDPCPPPRGLEDLRFVKIDPGVVDLGNRQIIVIGALCIGTKEVSRRDWLAVMGGELPRSDWPPNWPMTNVTPEEVSAFLERLEIQNPDVTYRLPTAAEWEFAARADEKTDYFFGDDPSMLQRYGNCDNALGSDGHDGPAPIGSYQPNSWGLYDVHGNVAEWVQWPADTGPSINKNGKEIALRLGGSFDHMPENCAFGYRRNVLANTNRDDTGFRVVREVEPPGDAP